MHVLLHWASLGYNLPQPFQVVVITPMDVSPTCMFLTIADSTVLIYFAFTYNLICNISVGFRVAIKGRDTQQKGSSPPKWITQSRYGKFKYMATPLEMPLFRTCMNLVNFILLTRSIPVRTCLLWHGRGRILCWKVSCSTRTLTSFQFFQWVKH